MTKSIQYLTRFKITLANIIADWILDGLQKLPPDVLERDFDEQFEYPIIAKVDVPNDLEISIIENMDSLFNYPWYCVNYGNFKRYAFSHEEQLGEFNSKCYNLHPHHHQQ